MEKYTFKCKDCGSKTFKKVGNTYVCEYCGYTEEVHFGNSKEKQPHENPEQEINPLTKQTEENLEKKSEIKQDEEKQKGKQEQNQTRVEKILHGFLNETLLKLILCAFLGVFGVHKFMEGKVGMGILYIFTVGLFGIGYIVDVVTYAILYVGCVINGFIK